jgi:type 1 glutamine amidotransferase
MRRLWLVVAVLLVVPASAGAAKKKKPKRKPTPPPRVLVYGGTVGYHHASIEFGNAVLARLARITGRFTVETIDKPAELTPARLAGSDIVLWNSTTGGASPFSDAQEATYMSWVGCGGGHMGVHASTDSYRDWAGWAELTGAFFKVHPLTPTSIADDLTPEHQGWGEPAATILVKDQDSPITAAWRGRDRFVLRDEYYALDRDPAKTITDYRVTLAFGGFSDPLVAALYGSNYAREQPLAWTGSYRGKNRISYTNLGHSPATWNRGDYQDSLIESIAWVGAKRPSASCLRAAGVAR